MPTLPPGFTWPELLRRTAREVVDDGCLNLAAELAFYFFLSLFPAILFVLALASFFPLHNLTDEVARFLGPVAAPEVLRLIQEQMERLAHADSGGLLTAGVLGALWSSSAAVVSIVDALNRAYDIDERRSWFMVRVIAIVLTVVLALFVVSSASLVIAGPSAATFMGRTLGYGPVFEWTWKVLQWPVAFALVAIGLGLVYYAGPDIRQRVSRIAPGASTATLLWLAGSLACKFYVATLTDYNGAYGAVGSVIVVLLWFYVSSLAILVGAEMSAEIEHAWRAVASRPLSSRGHGTPATTSQRAR